MSFIFDVASEAAIIGKTLESGVARETRSNEICRSVAGAFYGAAGNVKTFGKNVKALGKALKEAHGESWTRGPASVASRARKVISSHPNYAAIARAWVNGDFDTFKVNACLAELDKTERDADAVNLAIAKVIAKHVVTDEGTLHGERMEIIIAKAAHMLRDKAAKNAASTRELLPL